MADDGLVEITLGRDYGPHLAGELFRVSPGRAFWLRANGYEASPPVVVEEEPETENEPKPVKRAARKTGAKKE